MFKKAYRAAKTAQARVRNLTREDAVNLSIVLMVIGVLVLMLFQQ